MLCSLLLLSLGILGADGAGEDDLTVLPGINFQTNFKTYAGYLNAGNNGTWKMHYLLTESRNDPSTDPILVWFNGGPGCSSLGGMFGELGPFYINFDGTSLFENVYAWNARANVLALESPIGVGFSYDSTIPNYSVANDNQSMNQNYAALKDFFSNVQPKYQSRSFYLSGESYAGVYIPMLSDKLIKGINSGDFPNKNFMGSAIGNGFMNVQDNYNSLVVWSAFHSRISIDQWDAIKVACKTGNETDYEYYNYQQFMITTNGMDYSADNSSCGQLIEQLITDSPSPRASFDPYNYYEDCYDLSATGMKRRNFGGSTSITNNTAGMFNYDSTDNLLGYTCWGDVSHYLNLANVKAALHVPTSFPQYHGCNNPMYDQYNMTYQDMEPFFQSIFNNVKTPGFRFLIYNGDVDTVCNYLGDSWFIRRVAAHNGLTAGPRTPWIFGKQVAGYVQTYSGFTAAGNVITIDVVTVKGAGHFVPGDRGGPSLQMITNFMNPTQANAMALTIDYNSMAYVQPQPKLSPLINATSTATD